MLTGDVRLLCSVRCDGKYVNLIFLVRARMRALMTMMMINIYIFLFIIYPYYILKINNV